MSRFFVGQRVRVVKAHSRHELIGREARIVEVGVSGMTTLGFGADMLRLDIIASDGRGYVCDTDQVEPILPDGHRAGDYSLSDLLDRCRAGEGVPA